MASANSAHMAKPLDGLDYLVFLNTFFKMKQLAITFLIFATVCWNACKNKGRDFPAKVQRDITITPANAYADLFLDSLALEAFIQKEVPEDTTAQHMRNFYNSRNYSFAWFDKDGLTLQAEGFWNAHLQLIPAGDSSIYDKDLHQIVDTLLGGDSTYQLAAAQVVPTELRFTKHLFNYIQYAYAGRVDPEDVQWNIPRRKLQPTALVDSFLKNSSATWKPLNSQYYNLQKELIRYRNIEQQGGWQPVETPPSTLKTGSSNAAIAGLKKRLALAGWYTSGDTTPVFTSELLAAIQTAQAAFGLKEDGKPNKALIEALNVTVQQRIRQMLINLERMKWMPATPAHHITANIPEYRLHVVQKDTPVLSMNVVVGKAANRTVIFSDQLKYVVFSPYWNVPRSIVRNEIYPAMQRSRNYLARNNMEVTGYSNGLPVVRQKPGGSNALGRVKFIFPNSYNIYFHDTPSRSLFSRQQRAFSHGCIRVQQPFELAKYLLRNNDSWTDPSIRAAMNSGTEKWVSLPQTVPVFITYFTSWVDHRGIVHFANDIYGHDEQMAQHLFEQEN